MKYKPLLIITLFIAVILSTSCRRNIYKPDISSVRAEVSVKRLETDLFSLDPDKIPSEIPRLKSEYGQFLKLFSYVINAGDVSDPGFSDLMVSFCTDKLNFEVAQEVRKKFPSTEPIEKELDNAFRYYKFYFPSKPVPRVYTCITGFNNSIITGDSVLGIGLDRYLGSECDYYKRLQIYKYIATRMTAENIVPDCMYAWGATEWDFSHGGYTVDNVLAEMIHLGKLKFFEKCMLPGVNDTLIFGFTRKQMDFCRKNEGQMWQYLVEHNLLFSTDRFLIRKLTDEAPFTTFFTNESPGRASVWLGFRIVESYMMKNRDVTLSELMSDPGVQDILEKSRYSPR